MSEASAVWPPGASRMGQLIRLTDWSATSCGPIETWSSSLRTAVTSALDSRLATILLWGPDLVQIYNDGYQPILEQRHPKALGQATQDCWPEVWQFNEPVYRRVVEAGETVHFDDQEFVISSYGTPTPHFLTITYSPARDETGAVRGVQVVFVETTRRMALERHNAELLAAARWTAERQAFSLALSDAARGATAADDIVATASGMLGRLLRVDRVMFCDIDEATGSFRIWRDWTADGIASLAGPTRQLADFGIDFLNQLRAGFALVVDDVAADRRADGMLEGYNSLGIGSFLTIPLIKEGHFSGVLTVHRAEPSAWSSNDVDLCSDVLERTWSAAENAQAQTALRTERDQSHAVFDSMSEGFALIASDGTVLRMNESGLRTAQRTASHMIGHNHFDVWPETVGTELARMYQCVKQAGNPGCLEYEHVFANGVRTWLEVKAYRTPDGGLAVFFGDVGRRKQAELALLEADRRKDEFLAMLGHELRNPLAPIRTAAAWLTVGGHEEEQVQRASDIIARQASHLSGLVDDLLDVSRVTQGLVALDNVAVDLKRVVIDALEQAQPLIEARGHRLSLTLSPEAVFVLGDAKRLLQVVMNVLGNAVRYTPQGGKIEVCLEARAETVAVAIRDNGIGMSAELIGRAFDLFAQDSRNSDRAGGGLGLGLALVKRLVALHGGTAVIDSAGLTQGSEITVTLPRIAAPATPTPHDPVDAQHAAHSTLRILVVDDNADAADTLAMLLGASDHLVTVAGDGAGALLAASNQRFDVCILDIGLPDISGYELAVRLKALSPDPPGVLIAVTGYGQQEDVAMSAAAGFDHHLVKPAEPAVLMALLARVGAGRAVSTGPASDPLPAPAKQEPGGSRVEL